jgi:glycosyltransferase involved in cell wall biosynthesis
MIHSSNNYKPGEIDVLHLGYYMAMTARASIAKIVENLGANVPLRQAYWRVRRGEFDEAEAVHEINRVQPRILNVHGTGPCDIVSKINPGPKIVVTVHDSNDYEYCSFADVVVCVQPVGWKVNQRLGRNVVIIPNSVVTPPIIEQDNRMMGYAVTSLRFSAECIDERTLAVYERIGKDVAIYGYNEFEYSQKMILAAKGISNVHLEPWNPNVESLLDDYRLYCYFPPKNNPESFHGLKVLEAVAAGVPVVASRRANSPIIQGYNGYDVDSENEFADRCREVLNDSLFLENARNHAKTISNTMPTAYHNVYKSLL